MESGWWWIQPQIQRQPRYHVSDLAQILGTCGVQFHAAERSGIFFRPDQMIHLPAWQRNSSDRQNYSICGITHTLSDKSGFDAAFQSRSGAVESWDATICTSTACQKALHAMLDESDAWLKHRFGSVPSRHQTPVVPLGINTDDFAPRPGARARMRGAQNIHQGTVVVMTMSRLSVLNKFAIVPFFLALEEAAQKFGKKSALSLAGIMKINCQDPTLKKARNI